MFLVDSPTLWTASCMFTKRSDPERGPYVDLGRDFDHDHQGRIYVSRVAVETMATLYRDQGTWRDQARDDLAQALESALDENAQLKADLAQAQRELDAVDTLNLRKEPSHA